MNTTGIKTLWVESVEAYVTMPIAYDAAQITTDDVAHNSALRTLTAREAAVFAAALEGDCRVESRGAGDDDEEGWAFVEDDVLMVAWTSGQTTPCEPSQLRLIEPTTRP